MNNLSEWLCISSIQQRSYSKYSKPKDIFSWAMQRSYSYLVVEWSVQKNPEQDFDNREKILNNYHITIYRILYNYKVFISIFANHFVDFHLFSWAPQLVNLTYELILKNRLEMETLPCTLASSEHWAAFCAALFSSQEDTSLGDQWTWTGAVSKPPPGHCVSQTLAHRRLLPRTNCLPGLLSVLCATLNINWCVFLFAAVPQALESQFRVFFCFIELAKKSIWVHLMEKLK